MAAVFPQRSRIAAAFFGRAISQITVFYAFRHIDISYKLQVVSRLLAERK